MAKKKLSRFELLLKKLSVLMGDKYATKSALAAVETAVDLTDVSQATAAAIFSNYTFATTDSDSAQSGNEQSGGEESGES